MTTRGKGAEAGDWRETRLSELRSLIFSADPTMVEEVKWKKPTNPQGVPVWYHDGIVCTGVKLKNSVRLSFFKGAKIKDRSLFNACLAGNAMRAIDFHEKDPVDRAGIKRLILEAVRLNKPKMGRQ